MDLRISSQYLVAVRGLLASLAVRASKELPPLDEKSTEQRGCEVNVEAVGKKHELLTHCPADTAGRWGGNNQANPTLWQRLETIQEDDEHSRGSHISEEVEQEAGTKELEGSAALEEEAEPMLEQVEEREEEEREEQEDQVQTPSRARTSSRPKQSLSVKSKSRVYEFQTSVPKPKVRRKRRTKAQVKFQEDLFPDWVVQLMFNIEEATQHELVME
ncbi:hypothetical protein WMY93_001303 [Mugilogobius chulae]|uniref:Uncharacterized protein n=1 Tax=Mugilogobius chulae TaxID=88201 RepID=A0AAW0QBU0_9GOBI